ncbi:MAG TPA: hypothetical protein VHU91_06795 [Mycobacteriales bacterium]|jgi:hypothetical protein|nr:hypothetical protein [Mycobacteriales bacterium]
MNYKLGKHAATADPRRLMMSAFTSARLPAPPATCDRTYGITDWTPMGNSGEDAPPPGVKVCGDCAYAGPGHMVMAWSMGTTKKPLIIPDTEIVAAYASGTGYNPVTGAGDNGSSMPAVCEQWRTKGIGGNKITAYGALDQSRQVSIQQAVYLFGAAFVGLMLPQSAMQQTEANLVWTTPWFSPIIGGHAVPILAYDAVHIWLITWAKIQCATWDFLFRYMDEAFACIDPLWIASDGLAPDSGLNVPALVADLDLVSAKPTLPPSQLTRAA